MSMQMEASEELAKVHSHPVSTIQDASQPSSADKFPSSQVPGAVVKPIPSPQISVQTEAVEESPSVQSHPVSTVQVLEHPSLSLVLPSSHRPNVGTIFLPSPHI